MQILAVESDRVGIVTTLDGTPIEQGEMAGPIVGTHNNFQDAQAFLDAGGRLFNGSRGSGCCVERQQR